MQLHRSDLSPHIQAMPKKLVIGTSSAEVLLQFVQFSLSNCSEQSNLSTRTPFYGALFNFFSDLYGIRNFLFGFYPFARRGEGDQGHFIGK